MVSLFTICSANAYSRAAKEHGFVNTTVFNMKELPRWVDFVHLNLHIDCLPLHVGAQFHPQRLVRDQIDRTTQQVLQVKLHAEVRF